MLNNIGMMEGNALETELHKGNPISRHDIIIGQIHPSFNEIDFKTMTAQVTTVTQNLIKTTKGVNAILVSLERTSSTLNTAIHQLEGNVSTIAKNIIAISSLLADSKEGMSAILPIIRSLLLEIKSIPFKDISFRVTNMLKNVERLIQHASSNCGSFGLFIHDPTLYHNLNRSVENLNALLFDVKKKPWRYLHFSLFGGNKIKHNYPIEKVIMSNLILKSNQKICMV